MTQIRPGQIQTPGDATKYLNGTGAFTVPAGGGGGSSILSRVVFNPATQTVYSTTSTAFVDANATNLAITFTAPSSGAVDVVLESVTDVATDGERVSWNLRNSGGDVAGTGRTAARTANGQRVRSRVHLTGLTSGTSYTYKWGIKTSIVTAAARLLIGGGDSLWGPAQMEAWSA